MATAGVTVGAVGWEEDSATAEEEEATVGATAEEEAASAASAATVAPAAAATALTCPNRKSIALVVHP